MKRIAIGGLHTECSSYSPLLQQRPDFTRTTGDALIDLVPVDFAALGLEPVPIFHDRSVPGGPVAPDVFAAQVADFVAALRQAGPLDGALLLMHGAMFVPGVEDPEGAFLAKVRSVLGPGAILSASYDLHGQVTPAVAAALDAFAAYRTAPHVDVAETHARAARMLARALAGGPRPQVHLRPVPLLVPGEMSSTFVEPCKSLYAALPGHDATEGIWDANLMIGYVWADSPRATAAALVTATDPAAGAAAARAIATAYWEARHDLAFDMETLPLDAALDVVTACGPAILADSGDNPTAGGVGDRAEVLAALLARGHRGAVFAGIADPDAFAALQAGRPEILLGGTLGGGGPRIGLTADAVHIAQECAVADIAGNRVVITRRRRPFHDLATFAALGIDLDSHALLVVKSGYLSPDLRALPRRQVMALTDGAVSQDLAALANHHRPRGTFPFDR
ncbi:MAG: hypothetical protein HLUCCA08_09230 [Rhodobacteraceae bacterium HLUCCA08]|nr:MAG: hypothetical protein HLUCCA08_09230 [Rhodobacteraceae bacterium HLUCCA08]